MKRLTSLLLCLFLVAVSLVHSVPLTSAQTTEGTDSPPFVTSLESNYAVSSSGLTTVTHTFRLINQTPTVFIRNYGLKLSSAIDTQNVKVAHNGKPIDANIVTSKDGTSIGLSFTEPVVGEGKSQTITIQYPDEDVALITGQVLELHIPKLSEKESFNNYAVTIHTPEAFGQPTHATIQNYSSTRRNGEVLTTLNAENSQAISFYFGSTQAFDVTLDYHLSNTATGVRLVQIALPPDTRWQRVHYSSLTPQPKEITPDLDGNWIATYELQPQSEVLVQAQAQFQLSLEPDYTVPQVAPLALHTESQPFWDTGSSEISTLAKQHSSPRAIHNYVVSQLEYFLPEEVTADQNTHFPNRLGAVGVLAQPTFATCQEFTDLFVGIARAAKIPSRRITGYAYTQNSQLRPLSLLEDVLHAWPEYYDSETSMWRQIDPTWEKTTKGVNYFDQFDLNHLVFAINGVNSSTPYPAGSYKSGEANTKDVSVNFATTVIQPSFATDTQLIPTTIFGIPIPGRYSLIFTNTTGSAWYNVTPSVFLSGDTELVSLHEPSANDATQFILLPWQKHKLDVTVYTNEWWPARKTDLTVELTHQDTPHGLNTFTITAGPKIWTIISHPVFLVAMGTGSLSLAFLTGSLLVQRRKQTRSIRW